jgi:hypothetical protein
LGKGEERVNGVKEKGEMVVEWERGMDGRGWTSGDEVKTWIVGNGEDGLNGWEV